MGQYEYVCRLLPPGANATNATNATAGATVRKRADHIRRRPSAVLAHEDYFDSDLHGTTPSGKM